MLVLWFILIYAVFVFVCICKKINGQTHGFCEKILQTWHDMDGHKHKDVRVCGHLHRSLSHWLILIDLYLKYHV